VPTPGHTPGSYCYVDVRRGIAFVGDLVISHGDSLARPLKASNADDEAYLGSVARFAERAPEIGCAGHGPPVLAGFGEQLRELAALPRRGGFSPRVVLDRMRRLQAFRKGMSRRERPPPPAGGGQREGE
jgi:glyoxylase-like metal-dependent hydrolase (beta-lactamase superfamily II)